MGLANTLDRKTWIDKENVKDFSTAFFFCQDYFRKFKPSDLPYVSTAQTLNIQKQLLDQRGSVKNGKSGQTWNC